MMRNSLLLASSSLAALEPRFSTYDVQRLWEWPSLEDYAAGPGQTIRAIVISSSVVLPNDFIDRLPQLKLIASAAVGYDGVDAEYAKSRGIVVCNARGANSGDTADLAVALLMNAIRGISQGERRLREGRWTAQNWGIPTRSMRHLRAGIVGLGEIGSTVAERLQAFGTYVSWWGPRPKPAQPLPRANSLLELARASDALILTLRADTSNRHLIDASIIEALGPTGVLVNVARGSIVDQEAVFAALKSGRLGGAALDVFDPEPLPPTLISDVPNLIATPHIGGYTRESLEAAVSILLENLRLFFADQPVTTQV